MSYGSDMIKAIANPASSFKPLSTTYGAQRAKERNAAKLSVQCQECGRKFKSASISPKCPKCGSYDIDIA